MRYFSRIRCFLLITFVVMAVVSAAAVAGRVELGGVTLNFTCPDRVRAYDYLPVECKLEGSGEAIVQIVATDSPAYEKCFDTAIPHKIAVKFEYLSEAGRSATIRVTNVGDTIWKADGQGRVKLADAWRRNTYLLSDLPPGESVTRTYQLDLLRTRRGNDKDRRFVLRLYRGNPLRREAGPSDLELVIPNCEPGRIETKQVEYTTTALHDDFDELGHAYIRRTLKDAPVSARVSLRIPAWADRLVIRLIKDGAVQTAAVPLSVSTKSMRLGGKPTSKWTLNGKPIFVADGILAEEMPQLRQHLGGDNIVLAYDHIANSNEYWLKAVRDNGFKIVPISMAYVRLQMVGAWTGRKLMQGAPEEFDIHRVDALDPEFHMAMADHVVQTYENLKDVLFRTADGKVPICLSEEQSYGYPYAFSRTRWGGGTPADVAAFRVWLREKYDTVDKLNGHWKTTYKGFEEVDPSPLSRLNPLEYPDPWKEWGPAIEDFDVFRSKIHGEFWTKTVAEIKKRLPNVLCGLNVFGGYASETEPIYNGFFDWGVTDYRDKGVNWMARRIGCLPDDLMCFDFLVCWNTGSPEAAKKHLRFWHKRGKDVVIYARPYSEVMPGERLGITDRSWLGLGKNLVAVGGQTSFFTTLKTTYEEGGVPGVLNDPAIGNMLIERERYEIEMFNKEVARVVRTQ